ncbi:MULTISPECIES: glycosyltransferase family 4 protein [unclassified Psychrobacter]|uniref:glycosyltransferase family 4 protein n=1 Tax=unclassified Psychrobacter TaxID=196806 RepID=UPI003FD14EB0
MSKRKILFVASVAEHFQAFHRPYLKWFCDNGFEVHVACRGEFIDSTVSKVWQIGFERSPLSLSHIKSLIQLKAIVDDNDYALISCHTPMAGVLSRLSAIVARKKGTQLLYTAHGFHFFKGASTWSWLTYYPVEVALSYITDAIICINTEDFDLISKKGSPDTEYFVIPGIGVNSERFKPLLSEQKRSLKEELTIDKDDFVIIYAAEFIERKNHRLLIDAIKRLSTQMDSFTVLLAGKGVLLSEIEWYAKSHGVYDHIRFAGFVTDIEKYYQVSDVVVSTSKQEGLGINLVEAMMCGLPPIATIDRGHGTIIEHGVNGVLFAQDDSQALADAIFKIYSDDELRSKIATSAIKRAAVFDIANALDAMTKIYAKFLDTETQSS